MRAAGMQGHRFFSLIAVAAHEGAELCAFSEVFVYPAWLSLTDGARLNDDRQKRGVCAGCSIKLFALNGPR